MLTAILVGSTDCLVAIISVFFAYYFWRKLPNDYFFWWSMFFIFSALGGFLAGAYHILTPNIILEPYNTWLWLMVLAIMGCVTLIGFRVLAYFISPCGWKTWMNYLAAGLFLVYFMFVSKHSDFKYASICFGLMVISHVSLGTYFWMKTHIKDWLVFVLAWLVYICAALVQFFEISLIPVYLSYNTTYHLLAAVSWTMLFFALRNLDPKA